MSDEEIVPGPSGASNPGSQEGVGEHAEEGLGTDGVQRLEGEFGELAEADDAGSAGDAAPADPS
jgi:hypothetical protein